MIWSSLKIWFLACRPKTLPAAIAPVILGSAMALGDGGFHWPSAFLCFWGALFIQIGTNLANDYYDFKKGTDTSERTGPVRVTQAGLIAPKAVQIAAFFSFGIALIIAFELSLRGGWPLLAIGIVAIVSGFLYTAGPKPLGYNGLGEFFVFIFFGPVAVAGTYYIQTKEINPAVILTGIAPGLLSAAILVVNNLRDIETDRKANKKTLAVRFGKTFTQMQYILFISTASLMPLVIYMVIHERIHILWSSVILLFATFSIHTVCNKDDGLSLNQALSNTGLLLLTYSLLFSFGWLYADLRF
jgi:1,4-dihydroxy-2-naphthoate octaprenyltransferase